MSEEIARWCGYNSAWSMLRDHLTTDELLSMFQDLIYEKGVWEWICEIIEDLSSEHHEWVDHERIKSNHEDALYQAYKDGER